MKKELLFTVSAAAMAFVLAGPVTAAQPTDIDIRRCSNNGNGNGDEIVVVAGDPKGTCEKFSDDNNQDAPGKPGQGTDSDPN